MGYRYKPTIFHLVFEEFEGLEVDAKSVSIDEYVAVMKLADEMVTKPSEEQIAETFAWFTDRVVRWTLEDEHGKPMPKTAKAMRSLELPFAMKIFMAWVKALGGGMPGPLGGASAPGARPPGSAGPTRQMEASIPMTPNSGNLSS